MNHLNTMNLMALAHLSLIESQTAARALAFQKITIGDKPLKSRSVNRRELSER